MSTVQSIHSNTSFLSRTDTKEAKYMVQYKKNEMLKSMLRH